MLKIENLDIYYGEIPAVKDLTFEVGEKELVAIIGANGAGKTTLLNSIIGIKGIRDGTISLNGKDITDLPPWKRVELGIGFVPEGGRIFPDLSVEKNLRVGAYHRRDKSGIEGSLKEVFQLFPVLEERRRQVAGTLSGGERQMLAIGRALMAKPDLLLVDEISMGLMPKLVREVFSTIEKLRERGVSVLLAEQNAKGALAIVDRGYVLENGKLVLSGTAEELREDERVKKAYLGI
jgi:branched-chain amino acid transport system ATP-binding protein